MISFISPNLKNDQNFLDIQSLNLFEDDTFKKVWTSYLDMATAKSRVIGKPFFRLGEKEINVVGIRDNLEISFNENQFFYNDILILHYVDTTGENQFFIFKVTMDPKGRIDKVAHLLEGIWASYKADRPHQWTPGRTAIVQDRDNVLVARTDKKRVVTINEHKGIFSINIHDSGKFLNSSLGCTILEPESKENDFQFENHFKPLVKSINNKSSVDYCVINIKVIKEILKSIQNQTVIPNSVFNLAFSALIKEFKTIKL